MIIAIWFDVEDSGNRSTMEYFKIIPSSSYWKSPVSGDHKLSNSAYCGALFLVII